MEIMDFTAVELGREIRSGRVRVTEAAESALRAIKERDSSVGAYLTVDEEMVMARAGEVEKKIKSGEYVSPLSGVPVAVKDNICTRGLKTTCASRILSDFVPFYSAEAVKRLEQAGMIVLGKTNMDEFAMGSTTETSAFRITRNPWNPDHVPGGSSGGSCAAVASGTCFAALGSATGGSIRQPSSYCGVAGIKPTYGTVSRYGLIAYGSSLDQIGPIGRNTEDCAALLSVLASHDRKDATSIKRTDTDFSSALGTGVNGKRAGIPEEYLEGAGGEVADAVKKAAEYLEAQGVRVETFRLGLTEYTIPAYYILASAEASSNLGRFDGVRFGYRTEHGEDLHEMYKKTRSEGFGPEVRRRILLGTFVLSAGYYDAYYMKAMRARTKICQAFSSAFSRYDFLLAPAAPDMAPEIGTSLKDPMKMYLSDIDTVGVNLAGLPAMTVPCTVGSHNLPIGVQLIGDHFSERVLFAAASALEEARGRWKLPFERKEIGYETV